MVRSRILIFTLPFAGALACKPVAATTEEIQYPKMVLGQSTLEFGEGEAGTSIDRTVVLSNEGGMPMGVGTKTDGETGIDIGPGMDGNFTVRYDRDDIECPEAEEEDAEKGRAKGTDTGDSKPADTGSDDDDDGGGNGGGGDVDAFARFVLDPGCRIPLTVAYDPVDVGEVWGSLIVQSVQADQSEKDAKANKLPEYLRDPTHFKQIVYLHGTAEHGQGTIVVKPRSYDFGYVYPDDTDEHVARIDVENVGTGDVTLTSAALSSTCDTAFSISHAFADGTLLAAGESTLVEMQFDPVDEDAAYCQLLILSDDPANPEVDVTVKGNAGADPNNSPPTVYIRSPEPGYSYNAVKPLQLELNIFDRDQPATSLTCRVKSSLQGSQIADCTAPDESGHVYVNIARADLEEGIDTLVVTVTDASETTSLASVSVLINTAYPDSDDDGDGYGVESEPPDCDDGNRDTYPSAAEVYDGEDNDCDNIPDEGTEGFDDDGDGITEADGDCNDYNAQAYPGAAERGDSTDNDCDGRVDEGTSLYDDDGDGFAEVNNDCLDTDPAINPSATEICDGADNDCDGLKDSADGCIDTDSEPRTIGTIRPEQNACESGDKIAISVMFFDADGQAPTYNWQTDADGNQGTFDNPTAATVNWTCPTLDKNSAGKAFNVYVTDYDPDGHQDWAQDKIAVYPAGSGLYEPYTKVVAAPTTK